MSADPTATPGATATPASAPARLVVLVSGAGTNLGALLTACADPGYGARVVAVGSDRSSAPALERARQAGVATFTEPVTDHDDRAAWDDALTAAVLAHEPDLVVLAGFMRLVGPAFLAALGDRTVNTHPALSPSFPGSRAPADALAYGVKVTGATLFLVDAGVDTGAVLAQRCVEVLAEDTVESLHERIKAVERVMLVDTVGRMVRHGWTVTGRKVVIG